MLSHFLHDHAVFLRNYIDIEGFKCIYTFFCISTVRLYIIITFIFYLQLPSTSSAKGGHKSGGPVGQMPTTTPKMKSKRDRGVEQPLPNPFPLPLHYPSPVEAGLLAENPGIIPKYLSCVASSMLCHKMYPTRDEYSQVANEIIRKYPWMKSKLGPPAVSEINHSQHYNQSRLSMYDCSFTHQ